MQEISGSANTETGSYKDLKYAHLEHDDDKFNSNKDIDYEKTKFNQHHYYLSEHGYKDEDDFINQNYDEPIREIDEKHKARRQYKRMLGSYEEYAKKKENDTRRKGSNKPYARDRLLTRKYGTQEDKEVIYNQFLKQDVSIEEITRAINDGFHESTKAFNERYKRQLIIAESFTHLDEGADHTHDHLYAIGTDRYGKPRTDINQSLHDIYGGKKHMYNKNGEMIRDKNGKPKEFKKNNRDVWKEFRDEMDKSTVEHVNAKLIDLAKDKGIQFNAPKFVRKNVNENDYEEHDIYKANAQRKDKLIDDLVLRFPDKKLKTGKKDKTGKYKVTKPIKDEGTQAILRRGDIDLLMNLYKSLESNRKKEEEKKEKELKEREEKLKQREEEQKRKDDELNRRENQLEQREEFVNYMSESNNKFMDDLGDRKKELLNKEMLLNAYQDKLDSSYTRARHYVFYEHELLQMKKQVNKNYTRKDLEKEYNAFNSDNLKNVLVDSIFYQRYLKQEKALRREGISKGVIEPEPDETQSNKKNKNFNPTGQNDD